MNVSRELCARSDLGWLQPQQLFVGTKLRAVRRGSLWISGDPVRSWLAARPAAHRVDSLRLPAGLCCRATAFVSRMSARILGGWLQSLQPTLWLQPTATTVDRPVGVLSCGAPDNIGPKLTGVAGAGWTRGTRCGLLQYLLAGRDVPSNGHRPTVPAVNGSRHVRSFAVSGPEGSLPMLPTVSRPAKVEDSTARTCLPFRYRRRSGVTASLFSTCLAALALTVVSCGAPTPSEPKAPTFAMEATVYGSVEPARLNPRKLAGECDVVLSIKNTGQDASTAARVQLQFVTDLGDLAGPVTGAQYLKALAPNETATLKFSSVQERFNVAATQMIAVFVRAPDLSSIVAGPFIADFNLIDEFTLATGSPDRPLARLPYDRDKTGPPVKIGWPLVFRQETQRRLNPRNAAATADYIANVQSDFIYPIDPLDGERLLARDLVLKWRSDARLIRIEGRVRVLTTEEPRQRAIVDAWFYTYRSGSQYRIISVRNPGSAIREVHEVDGLIGRSPEFSVGDETFGRLAAQLSEYMQIDVERILGFDQIEKIARDRRLRMSGASVVDDLQLLTHKSTLIWKLPYDGPPFYIDAMSGNVTFGMILTISSSDPKRERP